MDKFSKFLEEKLMPIGQKINNIRFLQVIRMAMMPLIPFIIAGSFTLIVLNFPFIDKVLPAGFLEMLGNVLSPLSGTTLSLVAMFLAFLMGYNYAKTEEQKCEEVYAGITTLVAFLIVSPLSITVGEEVIRGVIPTTYMGSQGMFVALILCYLVAKVYCKILSSKLKIKLPDSVPPMVSSSFESLIPVIITLVLVCSINYCFTLTSFGNIHALVNEIIQKPLLLIGTGLPALLISQGLAQLLWLFWITWRSNCWFRNGSNSSNSRNGKFERLYCW
ncbi:PTS transporter subunit EIIC [Thomasclavelia ramosa]|uniref:PTS transporter subunit EIIC n=1 Tax=Thomasclavelia ramosa TaxID=1547 RepID=UPI002278F834|nr:PTS transporter subunit EIIC [Thomasclavelia ramosa]